MSMALISNPPMWLAGYIPDIPTPFDEQGAVDLAALVMLCQRQIDAGVTAILVSETGGEASTLTPAEQEGVIRAAVEVAEGRVHVIAVGSVGGRHRVDSCRVHREVVEQRPTGLELVALGMVERDEPVVTPVEVHPGPVHPPTGFVVAHAYQDLRAGAATGQHHRRRSASRLRVGECPEDLARGPVAECRHLVGDDHLERRTVSTIVGCHRCHHRGQGKGAWWTLSA